MVGAEKSALYLKKKTNKVEKRSEKVKEVRKGENLKRKSSLTLSAA